MLARLHAPMLFVLLGTPIAFFPLFVFHPNSNVFSVLLYIVPMIYAGGFVFSFGAGLLFSALGAVYRRVAVLPVPQWLGCVLGAFSGGVVAYMTFNGNFAPMWQPIVWGSVAGLLCGWLYTYQCEGRFVPIWGDAGLREAEDAQAAAKLTEFMRLKTDGTLDGPHLQCPSCNALIAQDLTACPNCKFKFAKQTTGSVPAPLQSVAT